MLHTNRLGVSYLPPGPPVIHEVLTVRVAADGNLLCEPALLVAKVLRGRPRVRNGEGYHYVGVGVHHVVRGTLIDTTDTTVGSEEICEERRGRQQGARCKRPSPVVGDPSFLVQHQSFLPLCRVAAVNTRCRHAAHDVRHVCVVFGQQLSGPLLERAFEAKPVLLGHCFTSPCHLMPSRRAPFPSRPASLAASSPARVSSTHVLPVSDVRDQPRVLADVGAVLEPGPRRGGRPAEKLPRAAVAPVAAALAVGAALVHGAGHGRRPRTAWTTDSG